MKLYLISLTLMLSMALFGCNTTIDSTENEEDSEAVVEEDESSFGVTTGSNETVIREIEGMDEEVEVINYEIQPYEISYQLDEILGVPKVNFDQITYSTPNNVYKITLEIIEQTSLKTAVSNLQEKFETDGYEDKSELESTPLEENNLVGEMQSFAYPINGFYVYDIDEHVLVITYQYPVEGGDGMEPLLEDLRKSIHLLE